MRLRIADRSINRARGDHAEQQDAGRMGRAHRQGDREVAREGYREERQGDVAKRAYAARRRAPRRVRHPGAGPAEDAREAGAARDAGRRARGAIPDAARARLTPDLPGAVAEIGAAPWLSRSG